MITATLYIQYFLPKLRAYNCRYAKYAPRFTSLLSHLGSMILLMQTMCVPRLCAV